ncbi:hypothetical protein PFMALIP_06045, partial [Plasmodium falciparum MaliPS096_E11]
IYNQRNHYITRTPKATTRTLCECELYEPANYDNDPQMKEVMDNFNKQTQQRFHEYDERMKTTRQKCKERCDKESQKIILKDKMEKQMAQQLTTLETKITTEDIPTCICEKSVADKMEKGCLRCGSVFGGGIAPTFGLIGSVAINMWKTTEIAAAIVSAKKAGALAGEAVRIPAAIDAVIAGIKSKFSIHTLGREALKFVIDGTNYNNTEYIFKALYSKYQVSSCLPRLAVSGAGRDHLLLSGARGPICNAVETLYAGPGKVLTSSSLQGSIQKDVEQIVAEATEAANIKAAEVTTTKTLAVETAQKGAIEAASMQLYTTIAYSILAILIIVLIMVIIYLILRYRRKKKMKKKLQYIKLLEE